MGGPWSACCTTLIVHRSTHTCCESHEFHQYLSSERDSQAEFTADLGWDLVHCKGICINCLRGGIPYVLYFKVSSALACHAYGPSIEILHITLLLMTNNVMCMRMKLISCKCSICYSVWQMHNAESCLKQLVKSML